MSDLSPLSVAKRKSDLGAVRSAFDPSRTLGLAGQWSNRLLYWRSVSEPLSDQQNFLNMINAVTSHYYLRRGQIPKSP
jgi:hypothetical protein